MVSEVPKESGLVTKVSINAEDSGVAGGERSVANEDMAMNGFGVRYKSEKMTWLITRSSLLKKVVLLFRKDYNKRVDSTAVQ